MVSRAVGEDEFAPGQPLDLAREDRIRLQRRAVDVMHELEKSLGLIDMVHREPEQGRAVARIIVLVQRLRRHAVDAEKLEQKQGDPLVDPLPYSAVGRVQGVVEIEDPGRDVPKMRAQHRVGRQPERLRGNQVHGIAPGIVPPSAEFIRASRVCLRSAGAPGTTGELWRSKHLGETRLQQSGDRLRAELHPDHFRVTDW